MVNIDDSKKIKYYVSSNNEHAISRNVWGLYVRNNYHDLNVLLKLRTLCGMIQYFDSLFAKYKVSLSYDEVLNEVLELIDDDKTSSFFESARKHSSIDYRDDLIIGESKARIIGEKDSAITRLQIIIPKSTEKTNIGYSALTHELVHYSLVRPHVKEAIEYSEALPMFFEYLIYNNTTNDGDEYFYNNSAIHWERLGIDRKYYEGSLAASTSYYDSFEYALQLIERIKEDKDTVKKSIGSILQGETSCDIEAKKLDIDTSSYKYLRKVIDNCKC